MKNVTREFVDHSLRLRQNVDAQQGEPADSYTFYDGNFVWRMGVMGTGIQTIGPVALRNRLLIATGHMPTYGQRITLATQHKAHRASRIFIAAEHSAADKPPDLGFITRRSRSNPHWPYMARLAVMDSRDAREATELVYEELEMPSTVFDSSRNPRNQVYERAAQFMTLSVADFIPPENIGSVPELQEPPNAFESSYSMY